MKNTEIQNVQHLACILDGNRRWAKERGLAPHEGHIEAFDKFPDIAKAVFDRGIKFFTVYAFSTENWRRPKIEVSILMKLFSTLLTKKLDIFEKNKIRLRIIGLRTGLSKSLIEEIEIAEAKTAHFSEAQLNICLNYGGRAEIVEATKKLIIEGKNPQEITEEVFTKAMWLHDTPDPDLVIRTSGEMRSSGFLLWEAAYSEWFYIKKYWPDFTPEDIDQVLLEYSQRKRRFGV